MEKADYKDQLKNLYEVFLQCVIVEIGTRRICASCGADAGDETFHAMVHRGECEAMAVVSITMRMVKANDRDHWARYRKKLYGEKIRKKHYKGGA